MNIETKLKFLLTLIVIGLLVGCVAVYRGSQTTVQFTVNEKERVAGSEDSKYLVFTDDEVFEITDTFSYMRFNSSDVYGAVHEDECYNAEVAGWRIPFLSMYRNIIKLTPCES